MRHPKTLAWLVMLLAGAHAWAKVATEVLSPAELAKRPFVSSATLASERLRILRSPRVLSTLEASKRVITAAMR
jgi:hypothetical protein